MKSATDEAALFDSCGKCRRLVLLHLRQQAFGRSHAVAVFDQTGNHRPIDIGIEKNANPTMLPDIGRHEEMLRVTFDHDRLQAARGFAPERGAILVTGALRRVLGNTLNRVLHGKYLIAHLEGRTADATVIFDGFG